jgi:integrase
MSKLDDARKWKSEHPDFPLTPHPNGQWAKKIRGVVHYFGPLANVQGALNLWLREKDYLIAGVVPPAADRSLTVACLVDNYIDDMIGRIAARKAARGTLYNYTAVRAACIESGISVVAVSSLKPSHFAALEKHLESKLSLATQGKIIVGVRSILKWGRQMRMVSGEIDFGPRFHPPAIHEVEADRDERGISRWIDREPILAAINASTPTIRLAILLGVNCGFYPADTIAITTDRIHLDGDTPYHDFRRVKTGRRRMAVLWPETVEAIREYESKREPSQEGERTLILDSHGRPMSKCGGTSYLSRGFVRSMGAYGALRAGAGIGSLRHVYGTVVDLVPDQAMIDLTMGHTNKSLQKRVYSQFNLNELSRLKVIADTVRHWLFYGRTEARYGNS